MKTTKPKTRSKTARQSLPPGTKIGGNGKIHFGLKDTPAHEVFVAGDFNGWNPAALRLECNGDGCWSAEIEVPPGRHEYLYLTDGEWRPDPAAECVPNPFGGVNSVITVGADGSK